MRSAKCIYPHAHLIIQCSHNGTFYVQITDLGGVWREDSEVPDQVGVTMVL
jgi:hypothetical protein